MRSDLIEKFKMVEGMNKVDYTKYFIIPENNRTMGNSHQLEKKTM